MSQNSYLREFCAQVSKIVFLADLTVLRLIRTVWAKISSKLISPRVLCTSITNRVLSWFDRFTDLVQLYEQKCHDSYLTSFLHKCQKIVFLADLTVLRLIRTVWAKISQKLYLREFYAQLLQIVFLADLTVLRLITTVWAKISQNSYVQEFCSQVSQVVFLADLTVLGLLQLYEQKYHKTHISASSVHKYQKSCS